MKITHCTLTGVDDSTDFAVLSDMSAEFPAVEWGFLYSPSRAGLPGRYPFEVTLQRAFLHLPEHVRVALHICGHGVPNLIEGDRLVTELVEFIGKRAGRVQLNFNVNAGRVTTTGLSTLLGRFPQIDFITQRNASNQGIAEAMMGFGNHSVLFDASGGNGQSPEVWLPPLKDVRCGYAGGLGPDNLICELERIAAVAGDNHVWIDMEGKLRTQDTEGTDWFDLRKARQCLEIVSKRI